MCTWTRALDLSVSILPQLVNVSKYLNQVLYTVGFQWMSWYFVYANHCPWIFVCKFIHFFLLFSFFLWSLSLPFTISSFPFTVIPSLFPSPLSSYLSHRVSLYSPGQPWTQFSSVLRFQEMGPYIQFMLITCIVHFVHTTDYLDVGTLYFSSDKAGSQSEDKLSYSRSRS